ncbi:lipopolysaccharide biosynthesis protein [Ekhidna sp.]
MGVVVKQSFWGTFIAYLGIAIGYLNALYFRAEYFDLDQIGLFTLITANAMIISHISTLGMASSYLKYFPSFAKEDQSKLFTFLLVITLLGNLLVFGIGYLAKDFVAMRYATTAPKYIDFIAISGVIILSNSLFEIFYNYSRSILKIVFPSFIQELYLRLGYLILVFGYAVDWWDFDASIVGLGILYFSTVVLLVFQLKIVHKLKLDFNITFLTKEWKNKLLKFGAYSMLLAGSFSIINNITYDQVTTTLGAEMNGIFTTCFLIAIIVEMPRKNMAKVIAPIISEKFENENIKAVEKIYKKSSITMSVIGVLIYIGIITNLNDLFAFIPKGDEFKLGYWVVVGVCTAKLFLMISSFAGEIINFSKYYRFNLFFQLTVAILLIVLNYQLLPIWGLNGAVIAYFSSIFIHILLKAGFVYFKFGIHPLVKSHASLIGIGIVIATLAMLIKFDFNPIVNILLRSFLISVTFITLIYRFRISSDINRLIHSTFERFLNITLPK